VWRSVLDGVVMGLGFTGALCALAAIRELLGGNRLLGLLVVDLVTVTADAQTTELPLRTAVSWPLLAAALAAGVLAAATLVTAASRRI